MWLGIGRGLFCRVGLCERGIRWKCKKDGRDLGVL